MIGQIDHHQTLIKYTHLETCQLLAIVPSGRLISYFSDFQELAQLKLMEKASLFPYIYRQNLHSAYCPND